VLKTCQKLADTFVPVVPRLSGHFSRCPVKSQWPKLTGAKDRNMKNFGSFSGPLFVEKLETLVVLSNLSSCNPDYHANAAL